MLVMIAMSSLSILHLLNYSIVQSPSWEANWFAASQEIPRISQNPKVHYRTYNRPPTVSILGQPNPVHIPTSHLLEIHPNIIHSSTPRSPQWSPSLRFPQQHPIHLPLSTHTRHMPSPSVQRLKLTEQILVFYIKVKKVKQSRYKRRVAQRLTFPDYVITAQDGGQVVSPTHRPPLPPGNIPCTHLC